MLSSDDEGGMDMDEETTEIESIIKLNMGVPVMLIANKSDLVHGPMTEFYKDKFDFIMRHLREHILMYGGTIMATSGTKDINTEKLLNYITNPWRNIPPELADKEAYIIPSGFDSPSLASQMAADI